MNDNFIEDCAYCGQKLCTANCCYEGFDCDWDNDETKPEGCGFAQRWFCSDLCHEEWHLSNEAEELKEEYEKSQHSRD